MWRYQIVPVANVSYNLIIDWAHCIELTRYMHEKGRISADGDATEDRSNK